MEITSLVTYNLLPQTLLYLIQPSISNSQRSFKRKQKTIASSTVSRNSKLRKGSLRLLQEEEALITIQAWTHRWYSHIKWRHQLETQARSKIQWARASLQLKAVIQYQLHNICKAAMQHRMPPKKGLRMLKLHLKATRDLILLIVCPWYSTMYTNNNKWLISQLQTKKSLNLI